MSNNIWDVYQLSNRRPQSQTRRSIRAITPQASNRLMYSRLLMGGGPCMLPGLRGGIDSHDLNCFFNVTSQGGLSSRSAGSQQQQASRLQQVTASAIRRFLRNMSKNPAGMSGRLRGSCVAPPRAQSRPATSQPVNDTVVDDERVRQEPVPSQESETDESGGTQPYINLLDNPIKNDEVAAEEPDLTLKL